MITFAPCVSCLELRCKLFFISPVQTNVGVSIPVVICVDGIWICRRRWWTLRWVLVVRLDYITFFYSIQIILCVSLVFNLFSFTTDFSERSLLKLVIHGIWGLFSIFFAHLFQLSLLSAAIFCKNLIQFNCCRWSTTTPIFTGLLLLLIVILRRIRLYFIVIARTATLHVSIRLVKSEAHSLNACWVIDKCYVRVVGLRLLPYLQSVYNVWNWLFQQLALLITLRCHINIVGHHHLLL